MISSFKQFKRVGLACVALGAIAVSQASLAAGTAANTTINNKATVNYQVSGIAQTPIESSPTGNSTAGVGNGVNTAFLVDRKIDLVVQEVDGAATSVSPGATNQVTTFFLRNDGNDTQGFSLSAVDDAIASSTVFGRADAFNTSNVRVFVESTACTGIGQTGLSYVAASDTATNVSTLAADACAFIYVVADVPVTATNGQASNVTLTAIARVPTTLAALTQTAGADSATTVDVVFADAGRDATQTAQDQYLISSAALAVQKTSTVVSDPFNLAVNPKAIPGAVVEYGIALTNSGGATATVVTITDPIPTNTTFSATNPYNSGASNVSITVGASPATFCVAEAGSDTNSDGCFRTAGGVLTVGSPALGNIASGGTTVTVRFRVTIN